MVIDEEPMVELNLKESVEEPPILDEEGDVQVNVVEKPQAVKKKNYLIKNWNSFVKQGNPKCVNEKPKKLKMRKLY